MPNGDILGPQVNAPLHVEIDAVAGTAYPIRVLSLRGQPRNFELSIRMK
jgi:hypothetical protein